MTQPTEAEARDNGGMTGAWLVVNCATGMVAADVDDYAEAVALRDGCEEDAPAHKYIVVGRPTAVRRAAVEEIVGMVEGMPRYSLHTPSQAVGKLLYRDDLLTALRAELEKDDE